MLNLLRVRWELRFVDFFDDTSKATFQEETRFDRTRFTNSRVGLRALLSCLGGRIPTI